MHKHFILSRTDSIGDVILTLPMAYVLKQYFPDCRISFLGSLYTQPIIACSPYIDNFLNWSEISAMPETEQIEILKQTHADVFIHVFPRKEIARLVKKSGIKERIGTSHRSYHWLTCNRLLGFSRKKSDLHEAQLNLKLLKPLGINVNYSVNELSSFFGLQPQGNLPNDILQLIDPEKINLVLHPKSKGSAREWGLHSFAELIRILPRDKFNIFVSGTEAEGTLFREQLTQNNEFIHDISGKLSLSELILFINKIDALVACSTGPLHIAAALGKTAIGIYPVRRPMHPGRWSPIGPHVHVFATEEIDHLLPIAPQTIAETLEKLNFDE